MTRIIAAIIERDPHGDDGVGTYNGLAFEACELAPLTGSPKQIAWADKIRAQALLAIRRYLERQTMDKMRANGSTSHGSVADFDAINACLTHDGECIASALDALTAASWWIDNREVVATADPQILVCHIRKFGKPAPRPADLPRRTKATSFAAPADQIEALVERVLTKGIHGISIDDAVPERRPTEDPERPVDIVRRTIKAGLQPGQVIRVGRTQYLYHGDGTITVAEYHQHVLLWSQKVAETPDRTTELLVMAARLASWPIISRRTGYGSVVPSNWAMGYK